MLRGCYGKEPFNLRLTALRMLRRLHIIAGVTILGTALLGGGYYVKNVLLRGDSVYEAKSVYHVEYAVEEERDVATVYINETSWNTYMKTQSFIDCVQSRLAQQGGGAEDGLEVSDGELREAITAVLASDLRVPSTAVTTEDPQKSVRIARAVEAVMTLDFPGGVREVESVSVVHSAETAEEVLPDVRVGRAFALAAVLSGFFAVTGFLLRETGDDSVWLPDTLCRRYGLKTVGTLEDGLLEENLAHLFRDRSKVAVCGVQEGVDAEKVLERLRGRAGALPGWFAVPSPAAEPRVFRGLREAEGILLAVRAGTGAGRSLEYVLHAFEQQDCQITAAILWEADEGLLRQYYGRLRRRKNGG